MEQQIYIPKEVKVGYNKRPDCYTKKLGFITYIDDKGKLRKENSWKGWIEKKLGIDDFSNAPLEGFVLNKNVGGVRGYDSWEERIEKIRCYDPRGFEIELTIPNVLMILTECTSTRGKGLEGTFVYGWQGQTLMLIPTTSEMYIKSQEFTKLQTGKISSKDLVAGYTYKTKKEETLIYLGQFNWIENEQTLMVSKKHIFVNPDGLAHWEYDVPDREDYNTDKQYEKDVTRVAKLRDRAYAKGENFKFIPLASVDKLAICVSETPVTNYADLMTKFNNLPNAILPVDIIERKISPKFAMTNTSWNGWSASERNIYFAKEAEGVYTQYRLEPKYEGNHYYRSSESKPTHWTADKILTIKKTKDGVKGANLREDPIIKTIEEFKELSWVTLSFKLTNNKVVKYEDIKLYNPN